MSRSSITESSRTETSEASFPTATEAVDDAQTAVVETPRDLVASSKIQSDLAMLTTEEPLLFKEEQRRERLTLEDCIDMDVDVLTKVLERNFQVLRRDTLEFFVDARTRFKTRALSELSQERNEAERVQQIKREEIILLEQEIKKEKQKSDGYIQSLTRMAEAIGAANLRKQRYRLLLTVFLSWVDYSKSERELKHKLRRALRYYCEEHLCRRALVQWVECIREQHRTCARERFQSKVAAASMAIEARYKQRLADLDEDNERLKKRLDEEETARAKLEEDMQQAFMRGVCALNMEALSVMKRSIPAEGASILLRNSVTGKHLAEERENRSVNMEKRES